jgi:hypothetical protein
MITQTFPPGPVHQKVRKAHKGLTTAAAVAVGRDDAGAIRHYLEALEPTRGLTQGRTVETVQRWRRTACRAALLTLR